MYFLQLAAAARLHESIPVQFFAAHRPLGQSVQAAINAPTQTVHVTSGARHCARARRAYYAPFPARARPPSWPRDDGYCAGTGPAPD